MSFRARVTICALCALGSAGPWSQVPVKAQVPTPPPPPPAATPPAAPAPEPPRAPAVLPATAPAAPAAPSTPTPEPAPAAPDAGPAPGAAPATPAEAAPASETSPEPAPPPAEPPKAEATSVAAARAEAPAERATEGETIIVTGSRIKRTSFAAAAPVQVVDRTQLEFSGAQNLGEVVQHLTAASGSDFNGRGQGTWGTTQINLRGLGSQATLILINGRRVVPSAAVSPSGVGVGSIVDAGQVPVSAIERIEILRGGASAIYGSDAVAGVVNIITRKDYDGLRAEVSAHTTEELDYGEELASATLGASSERARGNLSASFYRQTELLATDRDFTRGTGTVQIGHPASFIIQSGPPELIGAHPDPDCERVIGHTVDGGGLCNMDVRPYTNLMNPTERISALGYGQYDLTDHTFAFLELGVSSLRNQTRLPPSLPVLQRVYVPADHVDNPFGREVRLLGSVKGAESPAGKILADDDTLRLALGVGGDFEDAAEDTIAETWEWEVHGTYGRSRYRGLVPDTLTAALQEALNSCSDRADLGDCLNPFQSAHLGTGTPNSKTVLDRVSGALGFVNDSTLTTAGAGLTGKLFELPGGDAGFALGGQYRYEERASNVDHDGNQFAFGFVLGNSDGIAARNVSGGYIELLWPFYDGIELQTAGRLEHYEKTGLAVSPSAGLLVTPAEIIGRESVADAMRRLRFRGNVTSAFRAPSIYEVFPGCVVSIQTFSSTGEAPLIAPVKLCGNPSLDPEKATAWSAGFEWSPIEEIGFSSDYFSYDYRDIIVSESALGVYRNDPMDPRIEYDEGGYLLGVNLLGQNAAFARTSGLDFGAIVELELDEVGITPSETGTLSFGGEGSYVLRYEIPEEQVPDITLENGDTIRPDDCDAGACDVAGKRNLSTFTTSLPRLRFNVPVSWIYEGHSVSFTAHFVGSYEDDAEPDPETGTLPQIDSTTTFDLSYGYKLEDTVGKALSFRVGLLNLLDTDPPFAADSAYDIYTHDPRGRVVFARLTQEL